MKNVIGQVLQNTDNDGNLLTYEYDAQGNKVKTFIPKVDAAGNTIAGQFNVEIEYDIFGRKAAMIDPNMGRWEYRYDTTSKLRWQQDAEGNVTTMEYDRTGRMVKRTDHDGTETHWVYNDDLVNGDIPNTMAIGKLDSVYMVNAAGFELYRQNATYTADLGLADTTTTIIEEGSVTNSVRASYTSQSGYDRFHRPETLSYPTTVNGNQLQIKFAYVNGVMNAVKKADDSVTYWEADARNASGSVTAAGLGNGVNILRDYDDAGRLTFLNYNTGNNIYEASYQYDTNGTLVSRDSQRALPSTLLAEKILLRHA